MGLRLFHVSSACSQGNLIFLNPLKTAIGVYDEMQTGIEGADERGKAEACCALWHGHEGEKTPLKWLARNLLVPLWMVRALQGESTADICTQL